MRSLIIGTAGHIDHGKSALVKALTGTDPDRLKEEKERGITIDLGFAHLDLGGGLSASFVDVPGHERFVRNMLAGAHGVDAVMLVVAADESVMPQTREHFHICRLLGIPRGVMVLAKCDLADEEMKALAQIEMRELVSGSFLEGAEIVPVSARTGEGLDDLRSALVRMAGETKERPHDGLLRLPVDRSFTLRGFGTVVTGTLVSGSLGVGEEVEILPVKRTVRIRGIQIHGQAVDRAVAGHRTAVNLVGVEVAEVSRGDVLAKPGTLRPTSLIDVVVSLLPGQRPLEDQTRVRVHVASDEVMARVRVLGAEQIEPGRRGFAQLRLERRAVAGRGDRLILRSYSPLTTIGGAQVVDPVPPRRRRRDVENLAALAEEPLARAALRLIDTTAADGISVSALAARLTLPANHLAALLAGEPEVVLLGREGSAFLSRRTVDMLAAAALALLQRFHTDNPLRVSMPREELRRRLFSRSPEGAFEEVLGRLEAGGKIRVQADGLAVRGHEVRLTGREADARHLLLDAARAAGLPGIELPRLAESSGQERSLLEGVSRLLLTEGLLDRVGEAVVHHEALDALKAEVRRRWPAGSHVDVGGFKEMTGLSRKFVIPLLEYLDRERVTRRSGNDRVVLPVSHLTNTS